jgi:hypothetical protein
MAPICYRRHRFPPEIIQHAIWLYLRFTLSYRDVEELLAERGLDISYETVRRWVLKFGPAIARRLRQRRPRPSDTGKTHIALGLGLAACQKGLSVGFVTAAALVHELIEARDEKRLLRLQRQLAGYKLLIVDEFGYVPLSTTGAELLFERQYTSHPVCRAAKALPWAACIAASMRASRCAKPRP